MKFDINKNNQAKTRISKNKEKISLKWSYYGFEGCGNHSHKD
ncbi:MAG: hypothetical protein QXF25_01160 [Candidatus Pacearchaeota archaeon]